MVRFSSPRNQACCRILNSLHFFLFLLWEDHSVSCRFAIYRLTDRSRNAFLSRNVETSIFESFTVANLPLSTLWLIIDFGVSLFHRRSTQFLSKRNLLYSVNYGSSLQFDFYKHVLHHGLGAVHTYPTNSVMNPQLLEYAPRVDFCEYASNPDILEYPDVTISETVSSKWNIPTWRPEKRFVRTRCWRRYRSIRIDMDTWTG